MWLPHPKPPPIAAERFATIGDPDRLITAKRLQVILKDPEYRET
jgi:hypothetical protein